MKKLNYKLFSFPIEFPEIPPMVVGIWHGNNKPNVNEFLRSLILELKEILSNGLLINRHRIMIKVGKFIADTPARALLKGSFKNTLYVNVYKLHRSVHI